VFLPTVWVLTIARAVRHRELFVADLLDHGRSVGFFTAVAATCVLGSELFVVAGAAKIAMALWCVGVLLDFALTYTIFTVLTVKPVKPALAEGINGAWLTAVVAMQSVATLGAQLAGQFGESAPYVVFFSMFIWLSACMVYVWIISLIFYRYMFFTLEPSHLAPPY
jgi:tellurite resistance protein TehA-like permease